MRKYFDLWKEIFDIRKIDTSKDLHYITAEEIKKFTSNAEPRLLAKMDTSDDLPPVFKDDGYILLPVKNGVYAIVRGNGFHILEKNNNILTHYSKVNLLIRENITSESRAIDYAINTGAIHKVVNIKTLYPSYRGKCSSNDFNFFINKILLNVSSVQMEIDAGLEGDNSIVIVEGKINTPRDFIIRQLYYPYRHFNVNYPDKKIIPVFFTYDKKNNLYNFWIYEFTNLKNYNSINLIEAKSLRIFIKDELQIDDLETIEPIPKKEVILQANDLNKVLELVFKVNEGINNYKNIAKYFNFKERQSSYYREAAEALGLVYSSNGVYYLSNEGKKIIKMPTEERNIYFARLLLSFNPIKKSLDLLKIKGVLTNRDIEDLIKYSSNISGQTISRRANSLRAWLRWISTTIGLIYFDSKSKSFKLIKK